MWKTICVAAVLLIPTGAQADGTIYNYDHGITAINGKCRGALALSTWSIQVLSVPGRIDRVCDCVARRVVNFLITADILGTMYNDENPALVWRDSVRACIMTETNQ